MGCDDISEVCEIVLFRGAVREKFLDGNAETLAWADDPACLSVSGMLRAAVVRSRLAHLFAWGGDLELLVLVSGLVPLDAGENRRGILFLSSQLGLFDALGDLRRAVFILGLR